MTLLQLSFELITARSDFIQRHAWGSREEIRQIVMKVLLPTSRGGEAQGMVELAAKRLSRLCDLGHGKSVLTA